MKRKTKIIISGLVGIIFIPAWIYTIYLIFFDKSDRTKKANIENSKIIQYEGRLSDVGPSNMKGLVFALSEYTYLKIGNQDLKDQKIIAELTNTFREALNENCILYTYQNTIIAIKLKNGRTFCADYNKGGLWQFTGWILVLVGIPLIFALGIGILALILGGGLIKRGNIYSYAHHIPDAIILTP